MAFFGFADIGGLRLVETIVSLLLVDLLEWQGVYFRSSANHSTRLGLAGGEFEYQMASSPSDGEWKLNTFMMMCIGINR